ncbi:MAG: ATP-binding protein [Alphaproteobacteria bacterium]|nr:ATP-binding protein [Alphaproteobacteria bacterium]
MNLIFLGGIHGSGKDYVLDKIASKTSFQPLRASDVLKWSEYSHNPELKQVRSIPQTQDRLIHNLNLIMQKDKKYLLNGHFCLLNAEGKIERVPLETFEKLAPKSLYIKTSAPQVILERLKKRDAKEWPLRVLDAMQNEEIWYAKELSKILKIPLHLVEDNQEEAFLSLLKKDMKEMNSLKDFSILTSSRSHSF